MQEIFDVQESERKQRPALYQKYVIQISRRQVLMQRTKKDFYKAVNLEGEIDTKVYSILYTLIGLKMFRRGL